MLTPRGPGSIPVSSTRMRTGADTAALAVAERKDLRASMRAVADRLATSTDTVGQGMEAVFRDYASDTEPVEVLSPDAALHADVRAVPGRGGLVFVAEPDCGSVFLAAHIAAAILARHVVSMSLLRSGAPSMGELLAILEETVPRSFLAITKNGRESWSRVPPRSTLVILSPAALYFEHRDAIPLERDSSTVESRRRLIAIYTEDLARAGPA